MIENDPLSRNPEILAEMNQMLEGDPSIFAQQPDPLLYAFNVAINSVARKKLVGSQNSDGRTSGGHGSELPSTPPPSGGGSSGGPRGIQLKPPSQLSPEKFASLSSADQEKALRKMGVNFKNY